MVRPIYDGDLGLRVLEMLTKGQPSKSRPQYHYLRIPRLHTRSVYRFLVKCNYPVLPRNWLNLPEFAWICAVVGMEDGRVIKAEFLGI